MEKQLNPPADSGPELIAFLHDTFDNIPTEEKKSLDTRQLAIFTTEALLLSSFCRENIFKGYRRAQYCVLLSLVILHGAIYSGLVIADAKSSSAAIVVHILLVFFNFFGLYCNLAIRKQALNDVLAHIYVDMKATAVLQSLHMHLKSVNGYICAATNDEQLFRVMKYYENLIVLKRVSDVNLKNVKIAVSMYTLLFAIVASCAILFVILFYSRYEQGELLLNTELLLTVEFCVAVPLLVPIGLNLFAEVKSLYKRKKLFIEKSK